MSTPRVWRIVLAGFLAVLALVGFWPSPVDQPVQGQVAGFLFFIHTLGVPGWIGYGFVEASANVALFVPLGVLAALAFPQKPWWQIGAFGLLVSGVMEFGQLLFLHSRFPSPLDLVTNTAGCLVGFLLATLFLRPQTGATVS
ncbi:glycopeptide antibiotics resistance protein [Arthrobacter ginsengisoli]|uniref:Glycopeptide antibiotics resistance protein n=1 Tax=Arthrobacter ginsengisoli TaxID=1356565 RepID=A0ABU1UDA5_9MICC|nr:VanZ family protein [Arthrobacter ginsengisoli]MDR7083188.1 glycopeptide antibiotics resistance protein [Arthrobacter ginsengisoli]